jgi:hypothetical protein
MDGPSPPAPERHRLTTLASANLALRFLLELAGLAALGYWGFATHRGPFVRLVFTIGAPLLMAVVWGAFIAPRAPAAVRRPVRAVMELAIFGLAAAGLGAAGKVALAWAFGAAVVLSEVLLYAVGE